MLKASISAGVCEILKGLGHGPRSGPFYARELGEKWAAGDKDARKEVDAALAKAGLTIDDATAKTIESKLDSFERLDRMLASAEARRNNALREIDRHRDALGGGVRRSIEEIEDAEFRDVETGEAAAEAKP
jgi:protein-tyrosine-phosphatase